MICIEGLTERNGKTAVVQDFDLDIEQGGSVELWGLNGAGKTTVVRCLLGPDSYDGSITGQGLDAKSQGKAVRAGMVYVPRALVLRGHACRGPARRFGVATLYRPGQSR